MRTMRFSAEFDNLAEKAVCHKTGGKNMGIPVFLGLLGGLAL